MQLRQEGLVLVVVAVLLSAGAVAWLGVAWAGLPIAAALALGAIVAPPDAAAATAILSSVRMPRGSIAVLKGESLLNDASALLLFSAALAFQAQGGIDGALALKLSLAAPGGILLGILLARLLRVLTPLVTGTLGGNVFEFVVDVDRDFRESDDHREDGEQRARIARHGRSSRGATPQRAVDGRLCRTARDGESCWTRRLSEAG